MADAERPPLGSWTVTYTLCCGVTVLVIGLLYWLTATFQVWSE